uniref:Putative tick transposon n=1 Tax=Rhipicephalus microplus TaxID=6941 RepID=A0A6G5AAC2_RHIMP
MISLYINDVPRSLQRSRALMYADDTVLVFTGHSLADLQNDAMTDLSNISEWFARNQLTVNCTKTKYMVFHSRRKHIDAESLNLTINNTPIQQVPCFKYLGVTFDEHLHWHEQVQSVCAKLAYGCYSLIKARQYFPQAILRTLYFSLCHCHIGYCLESWGVTYNSYLKTLERLQKRTLKIISQGESVSNIFQSQRILSVPMLRDYKIAVSVNNIINRNSPLPADLFQFLNAIRDMLRMVISICPNVLMFTEKD